MRSNQVRSPADPRPSRQRNGNAKPSKIHGAILPWRLSGDDGAGGGSGRIHMAAFIVILIIIVIIILLVILLDLSDAVDYIPAMKTHFDHEKLDVYQDAVGFVSWVDELLDAIPKGLAVCNQLDRASTSIPLNIAEGNGKYTAPDRCRFFDIARGSALECAACLDVLVARKRIDSADPGKAILVRIVSMLVGLIRSTSASRVHEESALYCAQPIE